MLNMPGFLVQALIYESANSLVYRANRESDNYPVILKILKENYPTPAELARYRTEYQLTQSLDVPGVIKVYELQKYQNTLVMSLEDFGGESLRIWMQQRSLSLEEFLRIAIATTETLGQIHAANIIHKDINPSNIIFNPATGQLKIIDFGISTQMTRENTTLKNPNILEGTLAYMSPEQTGRMNRSLDYRTDFYSLGVTFYELLTGKLPFETEDALELVHCHIAKLPVPPHEVNPEIPKIVSDIVIKLMAKTAEERYQSSWGIKADLEVCLNQLQSTGAIALFPLAERDVSGKFQLPQKLYGREREIEILVNAFERSSADKSELMLVAGYSGIGKSALVQELYKPITEKRGYFISGKFDQFQRNIPYSAIVSAFRELIKQLLSESEAQLNQRREKLLAALGVNGQVIVEIIPEVELIIGKQPAVPELGPHESQNRFNLVFQNFIKVFTKPEHPLAIFLDDLQWADGASLKLMQLLMSSSAPGLFVIGAYRDNEVFSAHPLMLTLDEIAHPGATVNRILLSALELPAVTQLISDTLNCSEERAKTLADLVLVKTGGNPFFMNEFLKSLYTEKLLEFDLSKSKWHWDLEQIQAQEFTDNVVELMASKIKKLPESAQEMLKLAACIGNQFDLKILGLIEEKSLGEIAIALQAAVAEGLVVPLGNMGDVELAIASTEFSTFSLSTTHSQFLEYKFVHDRIQQAAYTLIPDNAKQAVHQKIGQLLLKTTPLDKLEDQIFDMVNQLNFGMGSVTGGTSLQSEKDELARLNLIAGKKAKLSAAYQPAINYLQMGIAFLATNSWQQQYHLTLSLYEQAAEVAYLNSDFSLMEKLAGVLLFQAKTVLEKVKIYEVKIQSYTVQGQLNKAINSGVEVLNLLGIRLPKQPTKFDVLWGLLRIKLTIRCRVNSFLDLPVMSDSYSKAALQILSKIASATYAANPLMFPLIVFQMVGLSIKWGNASESAVAYSNYGVILCGITGEIELGYQLGQTALTLLSQLNATSVKAQTEFTVHGFIRHWKESIKETKQSLFKNYLVGLEIGDLEFGSYSIQFYCHTAFLSGCELEQLESDIVTYTEVIRQMKQARIIDGQRLYHQAVLNLLGRSENPHYLSGEAYDERVTLPILLVNRSDRYGICNHYFIKLMLCYLFGELEEALANAEAIEQYVDGITAALVIIYFNFYASLARLATFNQAEKYQQKYLIKKVICNQKKMRKWAEYAPMNNLHKYLLVEAEFCRVIGKDAFAIDYYDKAIALAKENEYIHEAALAYELAAKFYLLKGKELTGRAYMQEARYYYQLWGAAAKVKDLEKRYPHLFTVSHSNLKGTQTTTTGSGSNLDIVTVMKASQTISGEIVLDKLLSNLMKILIENAGAQRGYLILSDRGKLLIEAEGAIDIEQVTVLQSLPVKNCQDVSEAIVNYVARTRETIVLNDATKENQFTNDLYIKKRQPKSILCVPLINQGKLVTIVYLENNLTVGAFTAQRQEMLNLLSAQAAISLENAQLYQNMAELNQAYERFVPSQFLQFLEKSSIIDVQLGDQVQLEMSVLFSDIRDFTTLSEKMTPEENFRFINSYLSCMEPAITENSGFIDKYIGDAIMALFSGEADNAVKAGISMLQRLVEYNQQRAKSNYTPIQNGIGINTGSLMLGTVGGQNRMDGTVISDAVNLASRVESLTKNYGVSLLITEQTYSRLSHPANYAIRTIDTVKVKGKSQLVTVYEVFDADPLEIKEGKLATLSLFAEALALYSLGKFAEAAWLFAECLRLSPSDRVAQIYWQRCQQQ